MHYFLLFPLIIFSFNTYSKCYSNIYSAGVSLDSLVYELERDNGASAEIVSTQGVGVLVGNIILCPRKKYELNPYLRIRQFELDKSESALENLSNEVTLPSVGIKGRYFYKPKFEIVADLEIRDEFSVFNDDATQEIFDQKYYNLKSLIGGRYFIKSNKSEDYTASARFGALIPLDNSIDLGYNLELDLEYFRRINKMYSIRADLFYSRYNQEIDDTLIIRNEVGIRYNYVFRY